MIHGASCNATQTETKRVAVWRGTDCTSVRLPRLLKLHLWRGFLVAHATAAATLCALCRRALGGMRGADVFDWSTVSGCASCSAFRDAARGRERRLQP